MAGHRSMVFGVSTALDTLSSQAYGAGQHDRLGLLAQRAFCISFATVWFAPALPPPSHVCCALTRRPVACRRGRYG